MFIQVPRIFYFPLLFEILILIENVITSYYFFKNTARARGPTIGDRLSNIAGRVGAHCEITDPNFCAITESRTL